jgi:hypothetical protein
MEPEGHYRVHNRPPPVTILSQIISIHTTPTYLRSSRQCLGLRNGLFTSGFPTNILHAFLFSTIRAKRPAYLILLDLIIVIILGYEYKLYHKLIKQYTF